MNTRLSSKGQVVLPALLRNKLGLRAGDELTAAIQGKAIVLAPRARRRPRPRIVTDPVGGVPVISTGSACSVLTSKQVAEALAAFP